jgi:tetratricopeptide (TPR) repeat protein
MKRVTTLLVILLFTVGLSAAAVQAQSATTFTSEGMQIQVPAGWQAEEAPDGGIFLANSDRAMELMRSETGSLTDSDIAFAFLQPQYLELQFGLAPDADPFVVIDTLISALSVNSAAYTILLGDAQGAAARVTSTQIPNGYAVLYAFPSDAGTWLAILLINPTSPNFMMAEGMLRNVSFTADVVPTPEPTQDLEALRRTAIAHLDNREYESAIALYDQILAADPQDAESYFYRGRAHYNLFNAEEALSDFDNAFLYGFSDVAWNYNLRGLTYADLGRYEEAVSDFTEALAIAPNYVAALQNRAWVNSQYLNNWEAHVADYEQIIELAPGNAGYLNSLGWGLIQLGRYAEALPHLDEALDISPDLNYALDSRGWAHLGLGNYDAARADFERAIQLDEPYSYYGLGALYRELGNNRLALEYVRAYLKSAGDSAVQGALDLFALLEASI